VIAEKNTDELGLTNVAIEPGKPVLILNPSPAIGECIFAFFTFETKVGRGRGLVNLTASDKSGEQWKGFTIYMCLQELKGFEERVRNRRPWGVEKDETKNWLDKRRETESMENKDPTVIVIGAGHSGLNIAARLGMLDILTLVIERNPRVGDNWRNRYNSY
jgi:putative flavoprotein involved in K+ transport